MEAGKHIDINDKTLSCLSHVPMTVHDLLAHNSQEKVNEQIAKNEALRNNQLN